jgi:hypothetical protein
VSFPRLAAEAPDLAQLLRSRLDATGVAILGTIRADGSPRLDPIEPFFIDGELVLGVAARTGKARDLRRDPRCALHAMVSGPNAGEPDAKLHGRVAASDHRGGWWVARPAGEADVYRFVVAEAVTIEWDLQASRMRVRRWTPVGGESVAERPYP